MVDFSLTNIVEQTLSNVELIITLLSSYVVIKALYNLVFVSFWHHGHWYFTLAILTFNIQILFFIIKINFNKYTNTAIILVVLLSANQFLYLKTKNKYNASYYNLYKEGNRISNEISKITTSDGIVEFDDGIIGYSLNYNTMSGFGLALDKVALKEKKIGKLFNIAYKRNYRVFSSLTYFHPSKTQLADNKKLRALLNKTFFMGNKRKQQWSYESIYQDNKTGLALIKFQQKK